MFNEGRGKESTSPESVGGYNFDLSNSIRTWRTSFLFFKAAFGGGASLLLRVLYWDIDLVFSFGFSGLLLPDLVCSSPFRDGSFLLNQGRILLLDNCEGALLYHLKAKGCPHLFYDLREMVIGFH